MYESESAADLYDLVYQDRKDYRAEAGAVAELIRSRKPDASTLLDVACGTGTHLEAFSRHFEQVAGLELSESMSEVARRRVPQAQLYPGDMRSFQLDAAFDAIVTGLLPPLARELVRAATGEAALTSDSAYGASNLVEEQPVERQAEPAARARRALGPYSPVAGLLGWLVTSTGNTRRVFERHRFSPPGR